MERDFMKRTYQEILRDSFGSREPKDFYFIFELKSTQSL